ncbi:uncharacterized protein LOC125176804 isoform X2 [Prionailurus viverrinus]|uniref:uncharacterized protein LOC125176804 isoform X2 n=1 Tax=Prionailurus viverrinus TaxID=61388 RepID=UPI001FF1D787|nr:uncharacterized protein LOC125176804 isoform X2 [Prionailurus viverrinus]
MTQEGLLDAAIDPESGILLGRRWAPFGLVFVKKDPIFRWLPRPTGLEISNLCFLRVLIVFFLLTVCASLSVLPIFVMGQNQSTPTPLSLVLTHFQDYKKAASVFGLHVKKPVLRTLCEVEWTSFQVEWPPQGSFDLSLVYKVHDIVFSRHEDKIPYIGAWRTLIENPPDWLKLLLPLPLPPRLPKVQALLLKGRPFGAQNKNLDGTKQPPPLSPAPEEEKETYHSPPYSSRSKNMGQDASDQEPTRDDCQQLLQALFTTEERGKIRREAQKLVMGPNGQPTEDPAVVEEVFPSSHPENWDPNTPHSRRSLTLFHQTLLGGLRAAARRPTNMSKVTEVIQGTEESPSAFLERLMEAYRTITPVGPEAPQNRRALNLAFVSQAAPDIQKKLQNFDGLKGKNLSELVEIAQNLFNSRDSQEERQTQKLTRGVTPVLDAREGRGPQTPKEFWSGPKKKDRQRVRAPLGKNQCAYCKQEGHWKKDCPNLAQRKTRPPQASIMTVDSD